MQDESSENQASEESPTPEGQPGVTEEDLGEDPPRARPEDLEIIPVHEVADPPTLGEASEPSINTDLVDDAEELLRTLEEAGSGEQIEIVTNDDSDQESP